MYISPKVHVANYIIDNIHVVKNLVDMRLKILNSLTNSNLIEYDKFEEYYFLNFLYNSDMSNFDYLSNS